MTMRLVLPSGVTLQRRDAPAGPADLPPHVLERIAVRWAERAGCPPGQVTLHEEELGWAVAAPGAAGGYATFVDKATGRVVGFANPAFLNDQYREQLIHERGAPPRPGFDASPLGGPQPDGAQLGGARSGGYQLGGPGFDGSPVGESKIDTPGVVAEVALGMAGAARAAGVRTDEPPVLAPLVRARLDAIPARARVRGAEWHPELIALSRAVRTLGAEARALEDLDPQVRLWRVREPADPLQGDAAGTPCATCTQVLGHRSPWPVKQPAAEAPSRWQRQLARRRLHRRPAPERRLVTERIDQVLAVRGVEHEHAVSPAAVEALERYLGADSAARVPGRSVRTDPFHIDPGWAADTADTLARVAARVGAPLFPLGTAGHEGILAIDPARRVFLIDGTGEWALGTGLPAALDTLLLGRPAPRVRG